MINQARQDKDQAVRDVATQAVWPFYKEVVSIHDRKDFDHDIKVVQTIPLPKEGWRFKTDLQADGHLQKWYELGFDDSGWSPISIELAWEPQGHDGYDGVAWYRRWIDLPARPDHLAAEICFDGVDECAWAWINGQYVGQHDIGPEGWDKPFALDVTKELKWGRRIRLRFASTTVSGRRDGGAGTVKRFFASSWLNERLWR